MTSTIDNSVADLRYVDGVDESRWIDLLGKTGVEQGDSEDGAFLAPVDVNGTVGLGVWQPYRVATARGFTMADNAIMDGADLDILVVLSGVTFGGDPRIIGKWNTNGGRREWMLRLNTSAGLVEMFVSDTGSSGDVVETFAGLSGIQADTPYVIRATYDESAGTITWTAFDVDQVLAAATAAAVDATVAQVLAGLTPTVAAEVDSFTPITMHDSTASFAIAGTAEGASNESITGPWRGLVRYAKVDFDGGTVTLDPARDGALLATTFTDATSGLSWVRQSVTPQSDWPTGEIFDGADFLATSYTPKVTATTEQMTVAADFTPGTNTFGRVASSESGIGPATGFSMRCTGSSTGYDTFLGGAGNQYGTDDVVIVEGIRYLLASQIDVGAARTYLSGAGFTADTDITAAGVVAHLPMELGANGFNDGNGWTGSIHRVLIAESAFDEDLLNELAGVTTPTYATATAFSAVPGLWLTSDEDRTRHFALLDQYDGVAAIGYSYAEADQVRLLPIIGRDTPVVLSTAERSGATFERRCLFDVRYDTEGTSDQAFAGLLGFVEDDTLSEVCVRTVDGGRWYATVKIPATTVTRFDDGVSLLEATVRVIESATVPAVVAS